MAAGVLTLRLPGLLSRVLVDDRFSCIRKGKNVFTLKIFMKRPKYYFCTRILLNFILFKRICNTTHCAEKKGVLSAPVGTFTADFVVVLFCNSLDHVPDLRDPWLWHIVHAKMAMFCLRTSSGDYGSLPSDSIERHISKEHPSRMVLLSMYAYEGCPQICGSCPAFSESTNSKICKLFNLNQIHSKACISTENIQKHEM